MVHLYSIVLVALIKMCVSVPPLTTESPAITEKNDDDLKGIRFSLRTLTDYMGKWNYIYISQLEPRIVSSAIVLANIDSNIRNIQERAHVWDTFQLHIAAWNEQLATSDRKLDIISKAQEEILETQDKMASTSTIDYKLDKLIKKLETFEENLSHLNKKIETISLSRDNLFGEFATRGILSTLKLIERKLDKIQFTAQNEKQTQIKRNQEETNSKLTIKCNTPPVVEELLQDVASKVDVIFDRVSSDNSNAEDLENSDYLDDQQYFSDENGSLAADTDIQLMHRIWKRISQPWKYTNKLLKQLDASVQAVNNNTIVILENEQIYFDHFKCPSPESAFSKFYKTIETINHNLNHSYIKQEQYLENRLNELKVYLSEHFQNNCKQYEKGLTTSNDEEKVILLDDVSTNYNIRSGTWFCDALPFDEVSGIYKLGISSEADNIDTSYYIRYCEIRDDGSWTVIQNRDNYRNLQNFNLNWDSYRTGFGLLYADFWFGNDFIHKLTQEEDLILRIELEDFEGNTVWAEYDAFKIASENENYRLTIGNYNGNASDSFSSHNNSLFSTFDVKNDDAPDCCPCAESYGGGWWFNSCFECNLNGVYYRNSHKKDYFRGIIWEQWLGDYSLKKTKMMVKQKKLHRQMEKTETTTSFPSYEDP